MVLKHSIRLSKTKRRIIYEMNKFLINDSVYSILTLNHFKSLFSVSERRVRRYQYNPFVRLFVEV